MGKEGNGGKEVICKKIYDKPANSNTIRLLVLKCIIYFLNYFEFNQPFVELFFESRKYEYKRPRLQIR
jgi:hypothetical protein